MKEPREYLNQYIKGIRYANQYVEDSAQKIIEEANEYLQKNFDFIRHFHWAWNVLLGRLVIEWFRGILLGLLKRCR